MRRGSCQAGDRLMAQNALDFDVLSITPGISPNVSCWQILLQKYFDRLNG